MALATTPAIAETIVNADSLMAGLSSSVEKFAAHARRTLLRQATKNFVTPSNPFQFAVGVDLSRSIELLKLPRTAFPRIQPILLVAP
jgi:hypothetical protein